MVYLQLELPLSSIDLSPTLVPDLLLNPCIGISALRRLLSIMASLLSLPLFLI